MTTHESNITIDADFPGGNIVVDRIDGDVVELHQELRDTEGNWFYWYFRVRGAAGRRVTFRFTHSPALGARGAAVSGDDGWTWAWMNEGDLDGNTFSYNFPADADDVRFSFGMPYLEAHYRAFVDQFANHPHLRQETLCETRAERQTECIYFGCLGPAPRERILLTARHHCCEMMANYVQEGIVESALIGTSREHVWLRENVQFMAIPFVDKDGAEAGDQGKNRRPHDHNRDYDGDSIYPAVRAIREQAPQWASNGLAVALDLHCPHMRGIKDESIYLVDSAYPSIQQEQARFSAHLEKVESPGLPYSAANNLPWGVGWNQASSFTAGRSFASWAAALPGIRLATTMEIAYANASGAEVTQASARAFGKTIATALARYLIEDGEA
jgi:hypothetical protein